MADTTTARTLAAIDRNIATCRAALGRSDTPLSQRAVIKSLIDDLLAERAERNIHCSLCRGEGKLLPGGSCSMCDRRRCLHELEHDQRCGEYVLDPYTRRCPAGHVLG
ncbi:hypothetical protein KMZ30_07345 [Phycicoccus sp. KQZ13P-1]|uniref:hypothetical protein n=1 Tax=Phycicoccus mangrovi TaxID=2840470 RepID=UPI001BFFF2BB|nr:hypothetical protein [Phycicoccus mangrovi]MBT9255386.1 hypothetical protein [Phycicoccus mangrovi]